MGLAENLAALNDARSSSAAKRKKRVSQLVSLVASIPDPEPVVDEDVDSALPNVQARLGAAVGGGKHSMNDGHGHTSQAEVSGLNAEFSKQLNALIKASGGKVKINSGYRSPERQAQLYAQAVKKYGSPEKARKWAAPPGKSNHNHGLAADLGYADAATKAWVHANAAKYGLVFPLAHEPWHIEPVGARKKRK